MRRATLPMPAVPIVDSAGAAALLGPVFAGLACERLGVLHLDAEQRPLRLALTPRGVPQAVAVPVRAMIADALRLETRKWILAHNHPAGDLAPSEADRETTRRLIEIAGALEIAVIDHLIFAGADWISFRALRLM